MENVRVWKNHASEANDESSTIIVKHPLVHSKEAFENLILKLCDIFWNIKVYDLSYFHFCIVFV